MKTDRPIYLLLSAGAEAFRVLTGGQELVGPYRFCSLTIEGLERRLDGIVEPDGPVYVVEFQGQRSDKAWHNWLTKIGLYGEEHLHRDVIGLGIFLREQDRPRFPRWANQAEAPADPGRAAARVAGLVGARAGQPLCRGLCAVADRG